MSRWKHTIAYAAVGLTLTGCFGGSGSGTGGAGDGLRTVVREANAEPALDSVDDRFAPSAPTATGDLLERAPAVSSLSTDDAGVATGGLSAGDAVDFFASAFAAPSIGDPDRFPIGAGGSGSAGLAAVSAVWPALDDASRASAAAHVPAWGDATQVEPLQTPRRDEPGTSGSQERVRWGCRRPRDPGSRSLRRVPACASRSMDSRSS